MEDKQKKALRLAGDEGYKILTAVNRIATLVNDIKGSIVDLEATQLESIHGSATRIQDILTLLENHVYIASTDSAYLIDLFGITDETMIGIVANELDIDVLKRYAHTFNRVLISKDFAD